MLRHPAPSEDEAFTDAQVRGELELEGSCLYVALDEVDERYPIVWPAGTQWDDADQVVRSPTGALMAIGTEVYGGGGYVHVADLERLVGPKAAAIATSCVDNRYGEIAVVNNVATGIGPADS